ncbi:MAG: 50S ribosomal protein L4 [Myxococcota bacterium]
MPTLDVFNSAKEKVGSVELDASVFGAEVKEHLFHLVVRQQLANRRQGTHATKRRAEVSGGGKKPWRQKGTGRARQGSTRAPHWRGGGVVFGPQPRSHSFSVNKKVRRAALKSALSRRVGEQALFVLDTLSFSEAKTRHFRTFMKAFGVDSLLVVVPSEDRALTLASRNIPGVTVLPVAGLNVYDVLRHRNIALTQPAIAPIVERLSR